MRYDWGRAIADNAGRRAALSDRDCSMRDDMQESRTAFVTGGGSGIGLAIVHALLDEGWRVVAADLSQDSLDQARQQLGGENTQVRFEQLDVTDEEGVKRAI